MPLITYPLNAFDFSAEDAELFHCTRTSGIYASGDFAYSITGADNTITIDVGIAWIRNSRFSGKVAALKTAKQLDMGLSDPVYPRIDTVAIQFDANSNMADIVVKQGTAASAPSAPAVPRTESLYELHLYQVYREAGAAAITAADITDLRLNAYYCGLMADSVTKIDTSAIEAQVSTLINNLRSEIEAVKGGTSYLPKSGGTMTGPIAMGNNKITGLATPTATTDAANKEYVDGKRMTATATLSAANWAGSAAPYIQSVTVAGMLATDVPHITPVYSDALATALSQKDAWAMISEADAGAGKITFTCFEDKPTTNIPIQIEVIR